MATNLLRYSLDGVENWGVFVGGGISPLAGRYPSTADLISHGEADWRSAAARAPVHDLHAVEMLAPVTRPCRIYCQGANYRQHMIESGLDPDLKSFNMFFTKADASLAAAKSTLRPPAHVRLLDYEIELGLMFRRPVTADTKITADTLADHVFALFIANDFSARDVQLPQMQFFKGKSYRGFCPVGPFLTVPEPGEMGCIDSLELHLAVNGATRQSDTTGNLVFKPAETITELSTFADIMPGDVLLTGTPSGCALRIPPAPLRRLLQTLPERMFWNLFLRAQARRPHYLRAGDVVRATIRSADGRIDLGEQVTTICGAA